LGERDCTAQRRRQKVIEEAPSPVVSPAIRAAMGKDAVAEALAVGYRGAGTVEFIVDDKLNHYFLEMNTRLQVEHPVTECITGYDLVEWQLQVAAGDPLPAQQENFTLTGHAIESRLYVEDPYTAFAPQTGKIVWWQPERALHAGVRIDDGIRQGSVVSPFYDPMVAKIIVHGRDRDDAIRRLRAALVNAPLLGLKNNGRFLSDLVDHPAFRKAEMTTTLIDQWLEAGEQLLQAPAAGDNAWRVAAMARAFVSGTSWRANSVAAYGFTLRCADESRAVRVLPDRSGGIVVTLGASTESARVLSYANGVMRFELQGVQQSAVALLAGTQVHLAYQGQSFVFEEVSPFPSADALQDPSRALSPVAGKVTQVLASAGDAVAEGQQLVCVEAMKMEMWLCAQAAGTVKAVHAKVADQVESGALLVELEINNPKEA
jgi:geranyl-CoA carboxylase alpha subunit